MLEISCDLTKNYIVFWFLRSVGMHYDKDTIEKVARKLRKSSCQKFSKFMNGRKNLLSQGTKN